MVGESIMVVDSGILVLSLCSVQLGSTNSLHQEPAALRDSLDVSKGPLVRGFVWKA